MKARMSFTVVLLVLLALPVVADWELKGYEWAIVIDDETLDVAVGDTNHRRIDRLREVYDEPFVWVRRGRNEWVITDPVVVRIRKAHINMNSLSLNTPA